MTENSSFLFTTIEELKAIFAEDYQVIVASIALFTQCKSKVRSHLLYNLLKRSIDNKQTTTLINTFKFNFWGGLSSPPHSWFQETGW